MELEINKISSFIKGQRRSRENSDFDLGPVQFGVLTGVPEGPSRYHPTFQVSPFLSILPLTTLQGCGGMKILKGQMARSTLTELFGPVLVLCPISQPSCQGTPGK